MKKPITGALLVCAATAALALPAGASAHPGIYEVTAKLAKGPEVQTITVDATGGSFKPSAAATAVDFDATAAEVQAALEADPAIGYGNVAVTQDPDDPFPYELTFQGSLAQANVAQVVPDGTGLTGGTGVSAATLTEGNGSNITFPSSLDLLANQRQAIIANDGYVVGIRETNGIPDGGAIQYKSMASAYRSPMTQEQKRTFAPAQTGYQAHATCQGVAALESGANILAWQSDPFYNYIPWQKASAGLGDDPATWIPVVQTAVGIDLSALNTVGEFTTACQSLGGTYAAADTVSSVTGGYQGQITALTTQVNNLNTQVGNLNTQVGDLNGQVAQLTSEKDALTAENAQLSAERDSLQQQLDGAGGDSAAKDRQIQSLRKQVAKLRKKLRRS